MEKFDAIDKMLARRIEGNLPAALRTSLESFQGRLRELGSQRSLRVAIIGEFNAGKSTLINRIIGGDYLATGNFPCTPVPIHIVYGDKAALSIQTLDGNIIQEHARDPGDLVHLSQTGWKVPRLIGLRLAIPSEFLKEYCIEIVDTPGTNAAMQVEHEHLSERSLASVHACLFLVYCRQPISKSCLDYINKALDTGLGVAILLTKMDILDDRESAELVESFPERLREMISRSVDIVAFGSAKSKDDLSPGVLGIDGVRAMIGELIRGAWARRFEVMILDGAHSLLNDIDMLLAEESSLIEEALAAHRQLKFMNVSGFLRACRMTMDSEAKHIDDWLRLIDLNLHRIRTRYAGLINDQFRERFAIYEHAMSGDAIANVILPHLQGDLRRLASVAFNSFIEERVNQSLEPLMVRLNDSGLPVAFLKELPRTCVDSMMRFGLPVIPITYSGPAGVLSVRDLNGEAIAGADQMLRVFRSSLNSGLIEIMNLFNAGLEDYASRFSVKLEQWIHESHDAQARYRGQLEELQDFRAEVISMIGAQGHDAEQTKRAA